MRIYFILIFFPLIFSACQSPLDRTYNAKTFEEDLRTIKQTNKVSDEDISLLTKFILVTKLAGQDLQGQTYGNILEKVKNIRKAGNDVAEREKNLLSARHERLAPLLEVRLLDKSFTHIKEKDFLVYKVSFHNPTPTAIKTVIGHIGINDLMDRQIKKIDILLDENIKGYGYLQKIYQQEYDHSDERDKRIRSRDLIDLRVAWNPEKIIFENGRLAE